MTRRSTLILLALAGALVLIAGVRLLALAGGFAMPESGVIFELRFQRVLSAIPVGVALAVSGVLLQSLLRNPLASPYILGLTAGSGLAIAISLYVGYRATGHINQSSIPIFPPVAGAFVMMLLVYALAQRRGVLEPGTLILTGVILAIIAGALTMFVRQLLPDAGMAMTARWLMGNLRDDFTLASWSITSGLVLIGFLWSVRLGPSLDAAALSDDEARSVGLDLVRLRFVVFLLASVMTGAAVVAAGPIGFVGLICPHVMRLVLGPSHRALVLGSALTGAILLVIADTAVTVVRFESGRMPIGVLTALIGGPLFIVILRSGRGRADA
ncbi:MAG: iron ABC transporter permease [Phycisphaerales bacterium]